MTFFDFIRKNIVTIFLSLIELTASGTLYRVFEDSFSKNILKNLRADFLNIININQIRKSNVFLLSKFYLKYNLSAYVKSKPDYQAVV